MLGLGNSISRSSVSEAGASALRLVNPLLLDTYSGAVAAYSLRKLSSDYSGKAIQIRRASDNVEVDVSFDSSGAVSLDSAVTNVTEETTGSSTSLVTSATNLGQFVANASYTDADSLGSADSALVQCWYDQSGSGNHATQDTAGSQPQIVSSGAVITENGKPAVEFDGTNTLSHSSNLSLTACSIFTTLEATAAIRVWYGSTDQNYLATFSSNLNCTAGGSNRVASDTPSGQTLYNFTRDGSTGGNWYKNSSSLTTTGPQTTQTLSLNDIGGFSSYKHLGNIQEIIVYASDESDNRTGIETSINTFYNIYS